MHLEMTKVPDKDEVAITIYAEPIKILSIEGNHVWCEWEGRRWKMYLPEVLIHGINSEYIDDAMRDRFLNRLNRLLRLMGEEPE